MLQANLGACALALVSAPFALAQSDFATSVVAFTPGVGGGFGGPSLILGGPQGEGLGLGSTHVLGLGDGGSVVLGFDVDIVNGPGADFTVFENGFVIFGTDQVFAEFAFVEVSTDGVQFARFPSSTTGLGSAMGDQSGLCGGLPVLANVLSNSVSPLDPSRSGGDSFDLAELVLDPAVLGGQVDLDTIRFVRLVDVLPGETDTQGAALEGGGGVDVDGVAVLNSSVSDLATKPTCDLALDAAGRIVLTLGDPQGFGDLDLASLSASIDLVRVPPAMLVQLFQVESATPNELRLVTGPVVGSGFVGAFGLSVEDFGGSLGGDQLLIQG